MASVSKQYGQIPFQYINGLQLSNNATTPLTKLDISAGSCLDSTSTFQITTASSITINSAYVGLNGLDTGTLAASSVYAIYLVFDPVTNNTPGAMMSLSVSSPLLPLGYSAFRLIGFATTDSSSNFLKGYWSAGNSASRSFTYDAPQATSITAGSAIAYTAVSLATLVPNVAAQQVSMNVSLVPSVAGQTLKLQPTGGVGDAVVVTGQVATVAVTANLSVLAFQSASLPKVSYVVSAAGAVAALSVAGYSFIL